MWTVSTQQSDEITLPPTPGKRKGSISLGNTGEFSQGKTKRSNVQIKVFPDTFVSYAVDKTHQWQFEVLPLSSRNKQDSSKLKEYIKKGGGIVVNGKLKNENNHNDQQCNVIRILDLEYVRAHIHKTSFQDMLIPYDCFSSNFIWCQLYLRCGQERQGDADLNQYRISPSAHVNFNANSVLKGELNWPKISLLSAEKLSPSITLMHVALQQFPELLIKDGRKRRIYTRQESQMLLEKVCKMNAHGQVLGIHLYNELASYHMTNRTCASLREHFRKTILPHILANDGYYLISSEDTIKFLTAFGKEGKSHATREKITIPDNDDNQ